jgi:hypothetical protein
MMTDLCLITDETENFFPQHLLYTDSEAIQVLIKKVKRSKREAIDSHGDPSLGMRDALQSFLTC